MTSSQRRSIPITSHDDAPGVEEPEAVVDGEVELDAEAELDGDGELVLEPDGAAQDAAPSELDELAALTAQRDEYLGLAQRTRADFENYRKRIARDARTAEDRGVIKVVRELLPALDNLQRALDSAASDDPLLAGVRLVLSDIQAAFGRLGVESFSPQGEEFDPQQHEAMAVQPMPGALPGSVVEVYQSGYRVKETMIRPARVVVAG